MVKFFVLLSTLAATVVSAQVQSTTTLYNVSSPSNNSPYVASQILPCIYDVAGSVTKDNLQLSIILVGSNSSVTMSNNADISQGFSFQKSIGGVIVYEHQFNYNIPSNTSVGSYQVVFFDNISQTNVTIPITISAAPITPTSSAAPSGSATSVPASSTSASIFTKTSSAVLGAEISKVLLAGSFAIAAGAAYVQL